MVAKTTTFTFVQEEPLFFKVFQRIPSLKLITSAARELIVNEKPYTTISDR